MKKLSFIKIACAMAFLPVLAVSAPAQGVQMIENFESYSSGVGDWEIVDRSNISVSIGINLTNPIEGERDIQQTLGATLLGSGFTLRNLNLDVPVPEQAENFVFSIRPLLSVNVGRNVTITLIDNDSVAHVSPAISLSTLNLNSIENIQTTLAGMTPPLVGGDDTRLTGIQMRFQSNVASLAAMERIDALRFTWTESSVSDWNLY